MSADKKAKGQDAFLYNTFLQLLVVMHYGCFERYSFHNDTKESLIYGLRTASPICRYRMVKG